jgi:hypothetical protein
MFKTGHSFNFDPNKQSRSNSEDSMTMEGEITPEYTGHVEMFNPIQHLSDFDKAALMDKISLRQMLKYKNSDRESAI